MDPHYHHRTVSGPQAGVEDGRETLLDHDYYSKSGAFSQSTQYVSGALIDRPAPAHVGGFMKVFPFLGLIITTALSFFLLFAHILHVAATGSAYNSINTGRASIQIAIQLISACLGFVHVTAATTLINYATRIRLGSSSASLDALRAWAGLSNSRVVWTLPFKFFAPLLLFVLACLVPSALWAGALTPVPTQAQRTTVLSIPSFRHTHDMDNVKEWPSEVTSNAPTVWTPKGLFSYAVGMKLQGSLLAAAASGTTVDGSVRVHAKLDATTYQYVGRSYGIAASPGLADDSILATQDQITGYSYQEPGYMPTSTCIYNSSSNFFLENTQNIDQDINVNVLWAAKGLLPDSSPSAPEYSLYIGRGTNAIVAIGVAASSPRPPEYLAIAAGVDYSPLQNVQCHFDFLPMLFNVTVSVSNKTISVVPAGATADIEPTGALRRTAMRQFELIANDQTNIYSSLVGDSFNSSINNLYTSLQSRGIQNTMTDDQVALAGVENSTVAVMDDMLVAYGSAQLIIGGNTAQVPLTVTIKAMRFGEESYIIAIVVLNGIVVLMVAAEAIRTRYWKKLLEWDYQNPADLLVGAWRGGEKNNTSKRIIAGRGNAWGLQVDQEARIGDTVLGHYKVSLSSNAPVSLHLHEATGRDDLELSSRQHSQSHLSSRQHSQTHLSSRQYSQSHIGSQV